MERGEAFVHQHLIDDDWVNSGVSSANNCNTNEAAKTSPKSHRYLTRTGTNHVRSNARPMLSASARFRHSNRVPFQLARYSCLRSTLALGSSGSWIRTVSSDTLASTTYRPSCRPAIAGSGRAARSSHVVAITPAFSPTCLAARTNSWIVRVRSDCRIGGGVAQRRAPDRGTGQAVGDRTIPCLWIHPDRPDLLR